MNYKIERYENLFTYNKANANNHIKPQMSLWDCADCQILLRSQADRREMAVKDMEGEDSHSALI